MSNYGRLASDMLPSRSRSPPFENRGEFIGAAPDFEQPQDSLFSKR
jgi:hypothetical protein